MYERKIFIVGIECTGLEQMYGEVCKITGKLGCGKEHTKSVNNVAIYQRDVQPIIDLFKKEKRPIDGSISTLWIAEELNKHFPDSIFVTFVPVVTSHIIINMMRSKECRSWSTSYRGIPFPSKFLGMSSIKEFQSKGLRDRCAMRINSHLKEIKRLRDVFGSQKMLVFDYMPGWEILLRDSLTDLNIITSTIQPKVPAIPRPVIPCPVIPRPVIPHPVIQHVPVFYWINLDRATERNKRMTEQLSVRNIPNVRIVAFDGANEPLSDYVPKEWSEPKIKPAKGEIATTLSHMKALHHFYKSGQSIGIICEDDLVFEFEPKWPYTLLSVINDAPLGWDLLQLSLTVADGNEWSRILAAKQRYQTRKYNWHSALAYVVTRTYAGTVLKRYGVSLTSDVFTCKLHGNMTKMQSEPTIIGLGSTKFTVIPPAFTYPTQNISYIHPGHLSSHVWAKTQSIRAYT